MESQQSAPATGGHPRRLQFSLRAVMIVVTDVAILMSFVTWMGKDGVLPAAVAMPVITVPILAKGTAKRRARLAVAAILLTIGVAWTILFPKTWDVFRPDTFASILFGVGLIGGGLLLLWESKKASLMLLWMALLWSVSLNLVLVNHLRVTALTMRRHFSQLEAAAEQAKQIEASSQIPEASADDETRSEANQPE